MKRMRVANPARGTVLAEAALVADGWWTRLRGLLGRPPLGTGEGLLLTPCHAVHMFGMRYPIDVAFLDRGGRVVAAYPGLPPRGRSGWHRDAMHALELAVGVLADSRTEVGDDLTLELEAA